MMNNTRHSLYIYIIMCIAVLTAAKSEAQQRTGYFMENYDLRHEMNPAFQPDSSYWSLPVLGNTQVSMHSTMRMGDILYRTENGKLTTFMTKGTVSKAKLLDAVGSGMKAGADVQLTLLSMGQRVDNRRYRTASVSIKATAASWLPKSLFDCMKEMENRDYSISNTKAKSSLYMEVAAGESRRLSERLTVGAKAKLLLGLMNMNAELKNMHLDMTDDGNGWTASGRAQINVAGMKYKQGRKKYDSSDEYYDYVSGVDVQSPTLSGVGAALDAGVTYRVDDRLTLSAAVTDLGFIAWTANHRAVNKGEPFMFDGFKDVSIEDGSDKKLDKQWDEIHDDLMDLMNLEQRQHSTYTSMLGATVTVGAEYNLKEFCNSHIGTMLTHRVDGKYSWTELRLNGTATPIADVPLDVAVSPAYSTFGFSGGIMINYYPNKKLSLFLGSDCVFLKVNPQMIPTSMNGSLQLGLTFRM